MKCICKEGLGKISGRQQSVNCGKKVLRRLLFVMELDVGSAADIVE